MNTGHDPEPEELPGVFKDFVQKYPALADAHQHIAEAVESYGPLGPKTLELIKIGISVGARLESATRSHVRRALRAGATAAEIEQAILLAYNTCGWPQTVMAWRWAREQIERSPGSSGAPDAL